MELHQLTEHCWYSDSEPSADRPSLGYILGTRGKAVIVDSGNSPRHFSEVLELIERSGLVPPSFCILTHWHWDHILGLPAVSVPVFCCEKTQAHLKEMMVWTSDDRKAFFDNNEFARSEYCSPEEIEVRLADITFDREITFDLGDISVIARHVEGPHSDDSVLVYVPEDGMLFAGDSSAGDFSLPNIPYDQELLRRYTETVSSMEFSCFLHSHREPLDRAGTIRFLSEAKERGFYIF